MIPLDITDSDFRKIKKNLRVIDAIYDELETRQVLTNIPWPF